MKSAGDFPPQGCNLFRRLLRGRREVSSNDVLLQKPGECLRRRLEVHFLCSEPDPEVIGCADTIAWNEQEAMTGCNLAEEAGLNS